VTAWPSDFKATASATRLELTAQVKAERMQNGDVNAQWLHDAAHALSSWRN